MTRGNVRGRVSVPRLPARAATRGLVRGWIALIALLCCQAAGAASGAARGEAAAVIIYADGSSFSLVDARGIAVQTDPVDPVGIELVLGDTVVTERDTFLELQLVPSTSVVRIAENTNFTIERRDSASGGTFNLVYGRVRARVEKLSSRESFVIRSQSATAGVRGTDFGVSVEVLKPEAEEVAGAPPPAEGEAEADKPEEEPPEGEAVTEVYCFEGEVVVSPTPPQAAPAAEGAEGPVAAQAAPVVEVVVRANEMVSITPEAEPASLQPEALPEEVKRYWEENDFQAEPVADAAALAASAPASAEAPTAAPAEVKPAATPESPKVAETPKQEASGPSAAVVRERLVKQTRSSRSTSRVASVVLLVAGVALGGIGIADALLPSFNVLDEGGVALMSAGAVFTIGGGIATGLSVYFDRKLAELQRSDPAP